MNSKDLLHLTDVQLRHYESVDEKYKQMYTTPTRCEPMFIINTPVELPTWEERLADPAVMLKAELDLLRSHIAVGDDRAMTVRVQFGTAQVAAAFGCELCVPPNNLPAARTHVLHNAEDVYTMPLPALTAGWYKKLENFTEYYQANLPAGVHIQLPDIQSAFNTAHLIRGNDILLDFYDDPEALCALLDKVTDYLIALVPHLNGMIACPKGWFYDWGILWKGAARISNCSTHMISPAMYAEYIYPRDVRLMEAIGGGRVHYCGTSGLVIDEFFKNKAITGLDYDLKYHSLWEVAAKAPAQMLLMQWGDALSGTENTQRFLTRLVNEGWPEKRNIIIQLEAASVDEGRALLQMLRNSVH